MTSPRYFLRRDDLDAIIGSSSTGFARFMAS